MPACEQKRSKSYKQERKEKYAANTKIVLVVRGKKDMCEQSERPMIR
jgi:hypothetical protein